MCALAERGAFDEAHELLASSGSTARWTRPWEIGVRHARARLWLAEGDFERAHAEAVEAGALGRAGPPEPPWRRGARPRRWRSPTWAAATRPRAGRRGAGAGGALRRAGADGGRAARPRGGRGRSGRARRVLRARRSSRARSGCEAVRLRLELGSALAYMGRRVEARDALRPALADADAAGAVLLARRARRELVATGLRPRQAAMEGTAALTPRQRQICELAAVGKGNRAIAQELFLCIKTVETHLAAGYRKLGVSTRAELAAELAA